MSPLVYRQTTIRWEGATYPESNLQQNISNNELSGTTAPRPQIVAGWKPFKPNTRSPFMELPLDVRLLIFESLFDDLELGTSPKRYALFDRKWVDDPLAILVTCRQNFLQAWKPFVNRTTFKARLGIAHRAQMFEIAAPWNATDHASWRAQKSRIVLAPLAPRIATFMKRYTIQLKDLSLPELELSIEAGSGPAQQMVLLQRISRQISELSIPVAYHHRDGLDELTVDVSTWVWRDWQDPNGGRAENILFAKILLNGLTIYGKRNKVKRVEVLGLPGPLRRPGQRLIEAITNPQVGMARWYDWLMEDIDY